MPLRSRKTFVIVLLAAALLSGASVTYAFRNQLRYGRVAPPALEDSALEPPLARLLRERTQAVVANPYSAEAWGMLAVAYDVHDMFAEAIACYERATTLDPNEFRWVYFLALSTRLGDREAALAHLQRAAELDPKYAPLQYFVGDAFLAEPDLERAQTSFENALRLDPKLVAAELGLAKIALARSDAKTAIAHLDKALALRPQTSEVHALFVEAYRMTGDEAMRLEHEKHQSDHLGLEPAADPIRTALLWRERVTLKWRRARSDRYLQEGRGEMALTEMQQAVSDAPESSDAQMGLGDVLARLGRPDEALAACERAVQLAPNDGNAQNNLGAAYARAGRYDDARKTLERALEIDPSLAQARNNLGKLLVGAGETDKGLEMLAESCKSMPNDVGAHVNWASALKDANRLEESVSAFREVLRIDPTLVRAHFELGLALAQLGRPADAVDELRQVVAADPTRASAHQNLVRALMLCGREEEAIAACRAGLRAQPADNYLKSRLAWLLATSADPKLRNGAEALETVRALVERSNRQDVDALRALAAALAETGDFNGAAQAARDAIELLRPNASAAAAAALMTQLERERALYESGQSYRKASP